MTSKKYTQLGTFSVAVMLPILIFLIIMLIVIGFNDAVPATILIFVIITIIICLLIFYKLTINIDDTHVAFRLGAGLVKKKYALKDIAECRPVKNNLLYGIGIRLTSDGWLYNVSGLYAIELTFKNKKSKVRIGTDKPEELSETINKLLNKPGSVSGYDTAFDSSNRSGYFILASIILLGLALPIILIISGGKDTRLEFSDSAFTIKGMYGMIVDYSNIIRIDTISSLPKIKARTNGYAFGNTLKGNFKLFDQTKVRLFVEEGIPPYIFIKTDETDLYLNFKDASMTIEVYKKITTTTNLIR
jgi:fumarate reductase subunit D